VTGRVIGEYAIDGAPEAFDRPLAVVRAATAGGAA
jgi:hypothetical protein